MLAVPGRPAAINWLTGFLLAGALTAILAEPAIAQTARFRSFLARCLEPSVELAPSPAASRQTAQRFARGHNFGNSSFCTVRPRRPATGRHVGAWEPHGLQSET